MSTAFSLRFCNRKWLFRYCLFLFLWLLGIIVGIKLAISLADTTYPLFAEAVITTPNLLGLILVYGVPFLLCAVGIITDIFPINCIAVALESVCRGFCGFGIYFFCGSGAWLLRPLFMFSSVVCGVLMLWLLLRFCLYGKFVIRNDFKIVAFLALLFIAVERILVSPFLIRLSIHI